MSVGAGSDRTTNPVLTLVKPPRVSKHPRERCVYAFLATAFMHARWGPVRSGLQYTYSCRVFSVRSFVFET